MKTVAAPKKDTTYEVRATGILVLAISEMGHF